MESAALRDWVHQLLDSFLEGHDEHLIRLTSYWHKTTKNKREEQIKEMIKNNKKDTSISVIWVSIESTAKDFIASKIER